MAEFGFAFLLAIGVLRGMLFLWAVLTGFLILLLIYRGVVGMHEDDQLILHESESRLQEEQTATLDRIKKIQPYIRTLSALSGALIVTMAGLWAYRGFTSLH